ncbi:hypothetical protein WQ56_11700 [Luteimonas sp. FCS-9]|nr:hypothetical protein WQ56_11700 [Luteimonas sp. FCS-9]
MLCAGRWRFTASYAAAHYGKSLFWLSGEGLLAYFLTEAAGLAPAAMGLVLALSLLASAASDLAVGHGLRGRLSRVRGAVNLQLGGALLSALALVGLFATAHLPPALRMPCALSAAVAFRVCYSVYDTPQNVLLSLATRDLQGRARAAAIRIAISGIAGLTLALAIAPLLRRMGAPSQADGFLLLAIAIAGVAVGSAAGLWIVWRGATSTGPAAAPFSGGGVPCPQADSVPMALCLLLAMVFALLLTAPLFGKLEPYFAMHVLASPGWGGAIAVAGACGSILSQPLWCGFSARRAPAEAIARLGCMLLACAGGWALLGRVPEAALVCALLLGVVGGGLRMTLWASFADVAARLHPPRVGLAYGLMTAASKTALALGALALGAALGGFDYRGADSGRLVWLMALGPAVGAVACIGLALAWRGLPRPRADARRTGIR